MIRKNLLPLSLLFTQFIVATNGIEFVLKVDESVVRAEASNVYSSIADHIEGISDLRNVQALFFDGHTMRDDPNLLARALREGYERPFILFGYIRNVQTWKARIRMFSKKANYLTSLTQDIHTTLALFIYDYEKQREIINHYSVHENTVSLITSCTIPECHYLLSTDRNRTPEELLRLFTYPKRAYIDLLNACMMLEFAYWPFPPEIVCLFQKGSFFEAFIISFFGYLPGLKPVIQFIYEIVNWKKFGVGTEVGNFWTSFWSNDKTITVSSLGFGEYLVLCEGVAHLVRGMSQNIVTPDNTPIHLKVRTKKIPTGIHYYNDQQYAIEVALTAYKQKTTYEILYVMAFYCTMGVLLLDFVSNCQLVKSS